MISVDKYRLVAIGSI